MVQSLARLSSTKKSGFTLIELVLVMIILGVLAVTAVPKLIGKSAFADYAVRDQLIARLRLVQLQGMNADPSDDANDNACYWLVVKSGCFYHEHTSRTGGTCEMPSASNVCSDDSYNRYNSVIFSDGMLSQANYRFDLQGRLVAGSSPIIIDGDNSLTVTIESQGYIHE